MSYLVQLSDAPETRLLAVRRRAALQELAAVIPEALGVVWDFIRASAVSSHGRSVVVDLDDEMHLEIGVEVGPDVAHAADGEVTLSCTPSGLVASTSHVGPHAGLPDAREAVRQCCRANRHRPLGPSWEVYDHRGDVPSSSRTDVHHLLIPGARAAT